MCVHKQSKAKQSKKERNWKKHPDHVMSWTGQDRTGQDAVWAHLQNEGDERRFLFLSFLLLLGDSPHRFRLSIYLSIGKQLGEVQGGREGGREF